VPLAPVADWLVQSFQAIGFEERAASFPTNRHLHDSAERWMTAQPAPGFDEDDWFDAVTNGGLASSYALERRERCFQILGLCEMMNS